jgi:Fur family ferric uptake transcriptional regulator
MIVPKIPTHPHPDGAVLRYPGAPYPLVPLTAAEKCRASRSGFVASHMPSPRLSAGRFRWYRGVFRWLITVSSHIPASANPQDEDRSMNIQPRKTKQKEAIRGAFVSSGRPLAHEEVLALAQQHVEGISIATVYRNINSLVEEKWLIPVEIPGTTTRYEVAGKEHHHHFKCNTCGKLFELNGCDVEVKSRLPRGFRMTGHEFFLYGLCASCA